MIEKEIYLDTKNTIWHRATILVSGETEQEIEEKVNNFPDMDYDEVDTEYLYDTIEELPLSENQYNSTIELVKYTDKGHVTIKDNLKDIDPEDVKMFSVNDLQNIWFNCYTESLEKDYNGFYQKLIELVKI